MSKLVAEAWVDAGYGTAYYDEEAGDCVHECYASVAKVILNEEYWDKFDTYMDTDLNLRFELGFCFDRFLIKVYDDESYTKEEINGC
jgi:hypothetical protein